jgi:hypothetical protein
METLEPNVSAVILSYLDDNTLRVFKSVLPNIIIKSQSTNTYWHEKTELLLDKQLNVENYNWKQIYNILSKISEVKWINAAIYYDSLDTIKVLIYIGKINNMNIKDHEVSPLKIASGYGKLNILKYLLDDEIAENIEQNSILMTLVLSNAVSFGSIDIVDYLLKKPINFNLRQCLYKAVVDVNEEAVNILLKDKRLDTEKLLINLVERSCKMGSTNILRLLLNDGRIEPLDDCILVAMSKGFTDIVILLLNDPRINPAIENNMVLMNAVRASNFHIVELLINNPRINFAFASNLALNIAIENKNTKMVKLLLQNDDIMYNLEQIPILAKDMIENSLKGMIIGNYFRHRGVNDNYGQKSNDAENKLRTMILRYIMLRKPTIIQIIHYLMKILQDNSSWVNKIKGTINMVAQNVLRSNNNLDISNLKPASKDLYHILNTFFLLIYVPKYSYMDILNIIDYKNFDIPIWKVHAIELIGAFLGFDEILKQNERMSADLIRFSHKFQLINILP